MRSRRSGRKILRFGKAGNIIRIDYVNMRDVSIDYEIMFPQKRDCAHVAAPAIKTSAALAVVRICKADRAMFSLRALNGEIRVQTGSGNVRGPRINGGIRATAGSGDIEHEQLGAGRRPDTHPGSGNIQVRGDQRRIFAPTREAATSRPRACKE